MGWGGGLRGGGGGGGTIPDATLSQLECFCITMGSNERHFNISLIVKGETIVIYLIVIINHHHSGHFYSAISQRKGSAHCTLQDQQKRIH